MKVVSEKALLLPEALEIMEKRKKDEEGVELGYEQQNTLAYLQTFSLLTPKKARELHKELLDSGLSEKQAVEVTNLLPNKEDLLKAIMSSDKSEVSEDKLKEILKVVKKYL